MMQAPTTTSEITAEWLSTVLDSSITTFDIETIGAGEGFMGQLARVSLTGNRLASGIPERVIVKMPTIDPGGRMIGEMMRVWEREHRFYTEVAPSMHGVRLARCLHSSDDPYVLILEDLHPLVPGDQVV
ncbi:MAG: hypothetical protein ACO3LC_10080, partial [Ilumatobacteraceae bacterium]